MDDENGREEDGLGRLLASSLALSLSLSRSPMWCRHCSSLLLYATKLVPALNPPRPRPRPAGRPGEEED